MEQHCKTIDVMCLGIIVADALAKPIMRIPDWRQLELVDQIKLHTGGCANNTGTGLARLGFRAGCMGKVGDDGFGEFILKNLTDEGIDIRGMKRDASVGTSFTFVMIAPDGERAFFHYIGANGALAIGDVDFGLIGQSRILHVAGSFIMPGLDGEPTAEVLRRAREMGVTTCLDTVYNAEIDAFGTLRPSLPHLDLFLPSIDEARLLTSQIEPYDVAAFLLDQGVGIVGLKMGPEGSYVMTRDFEKRIPAFKTDVVDTSGAGDAWAAGFLAGVTKGWELERCARLGSAMGALCCREIGTTAGLGNWDSTVEFMNSQQTLEWK